MIFAVIVNLLFWLLIKIEILCQVLGLNQDLSIKLN